MVDIAPVTVVFPSLIYELKSFNFFGTRKFDVLLHNFLII